MLAIAVPAATASGLRQRLQPRFQYGWTVWVRFIRLEVSRQSLQVCHRKAETRLPIIVRVARQRKGILRVDDLQYGRFPGLVAQSGEPHTFRSQFSGTGERLHFRARRLGFAVELPQMAQKFALRERQFDPCLVPPQLRLLELAAIRAPAENWNLQGGHGGVPKVPDAVGSDGELVRIDAIKIVEAQRWQQTTPGRRDFVIGNF